VPLFIVLIVLSAVSFSVNAEQAPQDTDPLWIDETMDSVITPFKQWLDKDPEQTTTPDQLQHANSIRSAIKQALKQHKGIVLSADEAERHYDIKILSESGTVNVVRIANQSNQSRPNNTAPDTMPHTPSGASE
jgi:hypothetical protein